MTIDLSPTKKFLADIREHAIKHYNEDGWDILVETYEDEDILEIIEGKAVTFDEAIKVLHKGLKIQDDYRKEIQSTAW
jgi:spore coat protein CotH